MSCSWPQLKVRKEREERQRQRPSQRLLRRKLLRNPRNLSECPNVFVVSFHFLHFVLKCGCTSKVFTHVVDNVMVSVMM